MAISLENITVISPIAEWFRWTLDAGKRSLRLCHRSCGLGNSFVVPMSKSRCEVKQVKRQESFLYSWAYSVAQPRSHQESGVRICGFHLARGKSLQSALLWLVWPTSSIAGEMNMQSPRFSWYSRVGSSRDGPQPLVLFIISGTCHQFLIGDSTSTNSLLEKNTCTNTLLDIVQTQIYIQHI